MARCAYVPIGALRFAGQITGVEGYVEIRERRLITGRYGRRRTLGRIPHRAACDNGNGRADQPHHRWSLERRGIGQPKLQPMNVNFGLFPPIELPNRSRWQTF